ncbi:MAG TPA: hypothetical protein VGK67_01565 [Myxococcales bacterium]|jgi:hypothetical protein
MSVECWVCGGRGGSQVILRPDGAADGRRFCRVCTRRLVLWLHQLPAESRGASLARIWPATAVPEPLPTDPEELVTRAACLDSIAAALPAADEATRLNVAIGFSEMGLTARALATLSAADPASVEVAADRVLTSLLSRLLHPGELAPDAGLVLDALLYPGPSRS